MREVKDTQRSLVRIAYDGKVHKTFRGKDARERFDNEVRILRHLEEKGCGFVPKVIEADPEKLHLVTTNCGARVEHLSDSKLKKVFDELHAYGVKHEDEFTRNVTYRMTDGRFCVIDFELASLIPPAEIPPAP